MCTDICVHSTQPNMQSMKQLGGSGGMPPRKFLHVLRLILVNFLIKITNSY